MGTVNIWLPMKFILDIISDRSRKIKNKGGRGIREVFMEFVIILILCIVIVAGISQYIQNENSPILTEKATLVRKINDTMIDTNGVPMTTLYLKFEINGITRKFTVSGRIYRSVQENSIGLLTYQGTRFISFESNGVKVER